MSEFFISLFYLQFRLCDCPEIRKYLYCFDGGVSCCEAVLIRIWGEFSCSFVGSVLFDDVALFYKIEIKS